MKKLIYLFGASVLVFGSCTNDFDSSSCMKKDNVDPIKNDTISPPKTDTIPLPNTDSIPVVVEPILLKKLTQNYPNSYSPTIDFLYDGTKIVSDRDPSNTTEYNYTGDLITKIKKSYNSGEVYLTKEYFYNTDKKVDYILIEQFGKYYKMKYTYTNDGTVFYRKFNSDSAGNEEKDPIMTGRYYFSNGNLIKDDQYTSESVVIYEYDSKNNPRLNILGFNLLPDLEQEFSINNVTKRTISTNNIISSSTSYTYEYNADGYPVKVTRTSQIGDKVTTDTSSFSY